MPKESVSNKQEQPVTQAQKFKKQIEKSVPTNTASSGGAVQKEQIIEGLSNPKFHGKKVDARIEWISVGSNHRSNIGNLDALKAQIEEIGLAQPIGIQLLDGQITCVYGHRRLAAFKELSKVDPEKYGTISCILQVYGNPEQGRIIAQAIENLGREDLAPLDECIAINETKAALSAKTGSSVTNEQLGDFLGGRHRKTIDLAIVIANWPTEVHEIIRAHDDRFSISALRNLAKKKLSTEELLAEVHSLSSDSSPIPKPKSSHRLFEKPRKDQVKDFDQFLKSQQVPEDISGFLKKQNSWLWSKDAREAVKKILNDYFVD